MVLWSDGCLDQETEKLPKNKMDIRCLICHEREGGAAAAAAGATGSQFNSIS